MTQNSIPLKFRKAIRFFVSIFASREFAFLYCMMGTAAQLGHTYFLTRSISSIDGWWGFTQAFLLSAFISSSLMYYTVIADNEDTKESKRIRLAVNIFMVIEIIINLYYYTRHLVIDPAEIRTFDFFFSGLIAILIPVTIKLYSGLIRAKEWMHDFMEEPAETTINLDTDNINNDRLLEVFNVKVAELQKELEDIANRAMPDNSEMLETNFRNIIETFQQELLITKKSIESATTLDEKALNRKIEEVFEKSQKLFLMQFENKCKVLSENIIKQKQPIIEGANG